MILTTALIPLEADDFELRFTEEAAAFISEKFFTIEFTVTDEAHYLGTIVEFRGDAAELAEMIQYYFDAETQAAITWR